MLARSNRFHGHGGVRRVYKQGRPTRTALFSLHVLQGERVGKSKVAVVVSRKIHKSAVKRNRIRRRIYELIRLRLPDFKAPAELVVTVYKAEVAEMPAADLEKSVDQLLKRAKL